MEKLKYLLAIGYGCLGLFVAFQAVGAGTISYNRDVRPILSDNCFHCHGPDQKTRKGKFRLDVREDAVAKGAIVPGKPKESELITRIFGLHQAEPMPPPEAHKALTSAQKELLRCWIGTGAKYEKHWAYVPPVKLANPSDKNPLDRLVSQRLHEAGIKSSPRADRRTLARRLYFDLVGLPPKPGDVEAFERDTSPGAVSRLVEKLLASPQFGERMAIGWLDVVRFADTIGYHSDNPRDIWPYRDYVIKAFNQDKPFDQFTREQLAGDLLPNSTTEQKVASAFNRLVLSTEEGGAQPKDYEARMLTDRVRAVSAVWLGQTIGCAQCHDHKFDPIKQRDFYALGAFFADIEEASIGRREPGMLLPDEKQTVELKRLGEAEARAQKDYDAPRPEWLAAYNSWQKDGTDAVMQERRWKALTPVTAASAGGSELKVEKDHSVLASGKKAITDTYTLSFTNGLKDVVGLRVEALPHDTLPGRGPGRAEDGNFVLTEVVATIRRLDKTTNAISFNLARADFEQSQSTVTPSIPTWGAASVIDGHPKSAGSGWAIFPQTNQAHQLVLRLSAPVTWTPGDTLGLELKQNTPDRALGHFRIGVTTNAEALQGPLRFPPPADIAALLLVPADQRNEKQKQQLFTYF